MSEEKLSRYELLSKRKSKKDKPKRRANKKFKDRLPNEILIIPNEDKRDHEKWHKNRNIAAFPRPFRALLCSGVNSGKTNLVKNILLRQKWDNIYLVPCDKRSREWLDFELPEEHIFSDIPPPEVFDHDGKNAIILEDYEAGTKSKQGNLSKLFRYVSTHMNMSVFLLYQDMLATPTICRRLCNVFFIWDMIDKRQLEMVGKRVGCEKGELKEMIKELCHSSYDNICFDLTKDTPYPCRLNLFTPIKKVNVIVDDE